MDQKKQSPQSQIEQFKKNKYHFDPETGLCLLPEETKSDYDNALRILSEQLYSKDIHFIFELLQNAEDNHYAQSELPSLSFELLEYDPTNTPGCKGCLVVRNNELGFEINNVQAISSIGKSTKANQKDAGYIGEKGIGFKSVFVVSPSPHIISNGFQIKFLKDDPKTGLGYIVPYWLDNNFSDYAAESHTTLLLPLHSGVGSQINMFAKVQSELSKLSPELVLFLQKLKKLSIKTPGYFANYELIKKDQFVELLVNSSRGDTRSKYLFKSHLVDVPEQAVSVLRANVKTREISLAFPVGFVLDESPLYCYLPTEFNTGLPFLINADFILNASRETIRQDLTWNSWMRNQVASFAAQTLAEILSSEGELSRWAWIPIWGPDKVNYWSVVRESVIQTLSATKCIPTLTGNLVLPSEALVIPKPYDFLKLWPMEILERLSKQLVSDDLGVFASLSSSIGLQQFDKEYFVELLQHLRSNDELDYEHLVATFIEITSLSNLQKYGSIYKYQNKLSLLRDCNLFKCASGLQSVKYKNLYLPSSKRQEVPILLNSRGESTKPNYINKSFYEQLPDPVKTAVSKLFEINEVNAVSYLKQSVFIFLKENENLCLPESLVALSKYLIDNIELLSEETIELLVKVMPFKNIDGKWIFPKTHTRYVSPNSLYEFPNWKYIYQTKEELQHIVELHEDYLSWGAHEQSKLFLDKFKISDFVTPFEISDDSGVRLTARPKIFINDGTWESEEFRLAVLKWLYRVYKDDTKIVSKYRNVIELGFFLLNHNWLLSTNKGFTKPSPTLHCFSENERNIFGDSLNYAKDNITKDFAKKLGLTTDPTPKGFMDQIKTIKDKESEVNEALLVSAYESLSNWKDPNEAERTKFRLTNERLIYLPKPRDAWFSLQQVTWEDKSDLGTSFVGLAKYLPERLKYYFVDRLGVNQNHGLSSYLSAYKEISSPKNKNLSSSEVQRLNAIVRQLSQFIRNEDFVGDESWSSFVEKCKVYSDKGTWLEANKAIFVADDGKTKDLFASHSEIDFTWSYSTEFYSFFEKLGVRKASEFIEVQISNVSNSKVVIEPQIANPAKKAICTYIADHYTIDDELTSNLSKFYDATEQLCEQLTVKYTLAGKHYVEVTTELGFYDADKGLLLLVDKQDIADVKDELALSIARIFFGRKASQHEKSIRVFIDIVSESRLASVLKKEGLELESEKTELLDAIFNYKAPLDELLAHAADAKEDSHFTEYNEKQIELGGLNTPENNLLSVENTSLNVQDSLNKTDKHATEKHQNVYDIETGFAGKSIEDTFDEMLDSEPSHPAKDSFNSSKDSEYSGELGLPKLNDNEKLLRQFGKNVSDLSVKSSEDSERSNELDSHNRNLPKRDNSSNQNSNTSGRGVSPNDLSYIRKPSETNRVQAQQNTSSSVGYRLFSYVESDQTHELSDRFERDDVNFGNKAELYVKQWLTEQGFLNIELFGGVNKGFDIQAINPDTGELIFIEVKGQRGYWNRTGVAFSRSQMEKCLQEKDSYWLVVVENLLSSPVIHKFVNPAKLIDRYYFDSHWSKASDYLQSSEPQQINLDDLFFDDRTKRLYQKFQQQQIALPEVGFEISNSRFEVIAELEFAWPEQQLGIYLNAPEEHIEDWTLYSVEDVDANISIISQLTSIAIEG